MERGCPWLQNKPPYVVGGAVLGRGRVAEVGTEQKNRPKTPSRVASSPLRPWRRTQLLSFSSPAKALRRRPKVCAVSRARARDSAFSRQVRTARKWVQNAEGGRQFASAAFTAHADAPPVFSGCSPAPETKGLGTSVQPIECRG